ncbi:unnamed protein product [Ambrosiozyma monospora]|uniref:Unnamed protein product n=1 Tax=Ambrosiozyma monospora TaxID=43982 RepID=A0ACB5TA72_AMBMO|nr:unnamed protein product [Ambrosiozyma monospora]
MANPQKPVSLLYTASGGPKRTRRKHKNSHLGCQTCKKRKIKCDERLVPGCQNCEKMALVCSYSTLSEHELNELRQAQLKMKREKEKEEEDERGQLLQMGGRHTPMGQQQIQPMGHMPAPAHSCSSFPATNDAISLSATNAFPNVSHYDVSKSSTDESKGFVNVKGLLCI